LLDERDRLVLSQKRKSKNARIIGNQGGSSLKVKGFNHVTIAVSDLQRSLSFYKDFLQMNLVHLGKTDAYLEWGTAWICLVEKKHAKPLEADKIGVDHVAFSIDETDFDAAVKMLTEGNIPIVRGPVERGLGRAVNFLDPDGVQLELYTSDLHRRMTVWK
jgi:catechol 2,3-dioxygenase-like lactoylglutathione lyase family enzyme